MAVFRKAKGPWLGERAARAGPRAVRHTPPTAPCRAIRRRTRHHLSPPRPTTTAHTNMQWFAGTLTLAKHYMIPVHPVGPRSAVRYRRRTRKFAELSRCFATRRRRSRTITHVPQRCVAGAVLAASLLHRHAWSNSAPIGRSASAWRRATSTTTSRIGTQNGSPPHRGIAPALPIPGGGLWHTTEWIGCRSARVTT